MFDRQDFFHYALFRKVLYIESVCLAVCGGVGLLSWRFSAPPLSVAPNLPLSLLALAGLALSSLMPVERRGQRLLGTAIDLVLVTLATVLGISRFCSPLYAMIVAKAAVLLPRKDLIITAVVAFLCEIAATVYKICLSQPQIQVTPFALNSISALVGGAFLLNFTNGLFMLLVAVLTVTLIDEQKSRLIAEKLSKEVKALATERERTRIAQEIHDSLGHTLSSLRIQLQLVRNLANLNQAEAKQALTLADELAGRSLNDVRRAVMAIRHTDFDLKEALSSLIEDIQSTQRLAIELSIDLPMLSPDVSYQLYRIAQESLTNVIKHAQATHVKITINHSSEHLELTVSDNGQGFEPHTQREGFGIQGMRERIASFNGSVSINGEIGCGTAVIIIVPLKT